MFYLTEFACVVAEVWMMHTFLSSFFTKKNVSIGIMLLAYGIFSIILTALSVLDGMIYVRVVFVLAAIATISFLFFHAQIASGFFAGLAFYAISAVIDFIAALIFQLCGFEVEAILQSNTTRSLYLVICHLCV